MPKHAVSRESPTPWWVERASTTGIVKIRCAGGGVVLTHNETCPLLYDDAVLIVKAVNVFRKNKGAYRRE